jgi:thiol-disulfide isomerase/thioredoxin
MPSINYTLYFANWCGHCVTFKPEWDKFAEHVKSSGNNINGVKINVERIEDSELGSSANAPTINGKKIMGYPTVKIALTNDDNKTTEYEYTGQRNLSALMNQMKSNDIKEMKHSN